MYEYKICSIKQNFAIEKDKTLEGQIIEYLENELNNMAQDGWEFYKLQDYSAAPLVGCLPALFGQAQGNTEHFKFMIFRRKKD